MSQQVHGYNRSACANVEQIMETDANHLANTAGRDNKQQQGVFRLAHKISADRHIPLEVALKIARYKLNNNGREPSGQTSTK